MNKKKLIWQLPFLLLLIIGTVVILKKQPPFRTNEGMVFGTVYKITYQHNDDLQDEIKQADQQIAMLEEEKSMMGTDEYIEEKARERLGYVKSDETVFVKNE